MSLSRAFTTRRNRSDSDSPALSNTAQSTSHGHTIAGLNMNFHLGRSGSTRTGKPIRRNDISGPVALVSTTNMLSYDAPNIAGTAPISVRVPSEPSTTPSGHAHADSSASSGDESDRSVRSVSTGPTATDVSSVEMSPVSPPELNHLSCYFRPSVDLGAAVAAAGGFSATSSTAASPNPDAPNVPQRVPSHSKKAHEHLHRKRTIQRMLSPPPGSLSSTTVESVSEEATAAKSTPSGPHHPFDRELRQLDAVAEGYSPSAISSSNVVPKQQQQAQQQSTSRPVKLTNTPSASSATSSSSKPASAEDIAEASYLASRNLALFAASEYMAEIQGVLLEYFSASAAPVASSAAVSVSSSVPATSCAEEVGRELATSGGQGIVAPAWI